MRELYPNQQRHLETVRWLVAGPPGSGRSHLLAHVMIETAMNNPGQAIPIWDHYRYSARSFSSFLTLARLLARDHQDTHHFEWWRDSRIVIAWPIRRESYQNLHLGRKAWSD